MERKTVFIYTGGTVYDAHVIEKPQKGDLIIAADAGYLTASRMGLVPDILVGDFDTLGEPPRTDPKTEIFKLPKEKDETDTQYAVSLALSRGAAEIVIVGGLEGRVDHTLSLLAITEGLWSYSPTGKKKDIRRIPAVVTNGKNRVRFLSNSGTILPRSPYRFFSLIALSDRLRGVTLEGCLYPLKNATISRTHQWAISNEIKGNCALIELRKGKALIIESMD